MFAQKNDTSKNEFFKPGEVWCDTYGHQIAGHGAGFMCHNGVCCWYGETRTSFHTFAGFSCYSSTDLLNWKNEGFAFVPENLPPNMMN